MVDKGSSQTVQKRTRYGALGERGGGGKMVQALAGKVRRQCKWDEVGKLKVESR